MAPKKTNKKRRILKPRPVKTNCIFCKGDKEPSYKDYETLRKYVSDRAKIIGKARTGVCTRHQRALAREIKKARVLGLISFTPNL